MNRHPKMIGWLLVLSLGTAALASAHAGPQSSAAPKTPGAAPGSQSSSQSKQDDSAKQLILPFKALGTRERLAKLKSVKIAARATFADAPNKNDVTVAWSWEPQIVIAFTEDSEDRIKDYRKLLDQARDAGVTPGPLVRELIKATAKAVKIERRLDHETAAQFDKQVWTLWEKRDFKPFLKTVLLISGSEVFEVFNGAVLLPVKGEQAACDRSLCFALSLSSLVPVQRLAFPVEAGKETAVKGKNCTHFKVQEPQGGKLDMYFDKESNLLSKITHRGVDPRRRSLRLQVDWEHFFSEYQEVNGVKQWRQVEIHADGRQFAVLRVSEVECSDEVPDLKQRMLDGKRPKADPDKKVDPTELKDKSEAAAARALEAAQKYQRDGDIYLAIARLKNLLDEFPKTAAAKKAQELLAEVQARYEADAAKALEKARQQRNVEAQRSQLNAVIEQFPQTAAADQAQKLLLKLPKKK